MLMAGLSQLKLAGNFLELASRQLRATIILATVGKNLQKKLTIVEHLLVGIDAGVVGNNLGSDLLGQVLSANAAVKTRLGLTARAGTSELFVISGKKPSDEVDWCITNHSVEPGSEADVSSSIVSLGAPVSCVQEH
jgi:hypothetical protein